jgi:hypothetical protein
MSYITRIFERIWRVKPVLASNAARTRKLEEPVEKPETEAVALSDELDSSRAGIERVLSDLNTDDDSLVRADLRLSLLRMFKLLNDGAQSFDMKDLTACVQRLSALMKETDAAAENGVSEEAMTELERDAGLM